MLYCRLLPDGVFVYLRHKAAPQDAGGLAGVFWLNYGAGTEMWLMVMIIAPALVLAPYLLCRWDEYMRAENARRRAARKRIYERARNHE